MILRRQFSAKHNASQGKNYLFCAVLGAPAYLGRQFAASTSSFLSGNGITACKSIILLTVSTISGSVSISQRAASAFLAYCRASSSSALARFMCLASSSRQASSIFPSVSRGDLQSSRNSRDGRAGITGSLFLAGSRTVLPSQLSCQDIVLKINNLLAILTRSYA